MTDITNAEYVPPTSESMAERQNDDEALRLLLAQRRLYTKAKRWQGVRWIGLVILGVAAPFISILVPELAIPAGAITGVWLFIGRTWFASAEARSMTKAAAIQEELDFHIFSMPRTIDRTSKPSIEEVERHVQSDVGLREAAEQERLIDWYDIDPNHPGAESIAIAQRSNASYTDSLIRSALRIWAVMTAIWLGVLVIWSAVSGLTFGLILLGVIFPVLPTVLDIDEYFRNTWRAAQDRADLAETIQARIEDDQPISGQELIAWQVQMYDLRRTTPQVPDWLYRFTREKNEAAMHAAANWLRRGKR